MKNLIAALRHPAEHDWVHLRPFQRHSLVLAVAGGVYVIYGIVLVATEPTDSRAVGLKFASEVMDIATWGYVWIVAGCLALISSRWPPASKTWGYTALTGIALCWAATYGVGVLLLEAPVSGLSGALVWGLVGFLWWAISGLINPDDILGMVTDATNAPSQPMDPPDGSLP